MGRIANDFVRTAKEPRKCAHDLLGSGKGPGLAEGKAQFRSWSKTSASDPGTQLVVRWRDYMSRSVSADPPRNSFEDNIVGRQGDVSCPAVAPSVPRAE